MGQQRVRHACARCRRQKLKCDSTRPCQLCVRSGFACEEATERTRRSNRATPRALRDSRTHPSVSRTSPPEGNSTPGEVVGSFQQEFNVPQETLRTPPCRPTISHEPAIQKPQAAAYHQERASTFRLVEKLFHMYSSGPEQSDAIPDGVQQTNTGMSGQNRAVPFKDLMGIDLPPPRLTHALIDSYVESTGWYCTVVHEPIFRKQLSPILNSGMAHRSDKQFLLLLLAVLQIGATFIDPAEAEATSGGTVSIPTLQAEIQSVIRRSYLDCFHGLSVHGVSFLFLLSSIFFGQKEPMLALSILGMAIRGAQSLELHREAFWGHINNAERQLRRTVWWSLYMTDSYSSHLFGKPAIIHENDCHVSLPEDIDESIPVCPGFGSLEERANGSFRPVTTWSYNRYKTKLYLIAAPITRLMYTSGQTNDLGIIISQVKHIHAQLLEWERGIPPELRPDSFRNRGDDIHRDRTVRVFALQSLTLQTAYDNIQVLLSRPFIGFGRPTDVSPGVHPKAPSIRSRLEREILSMSRDQCWTSSVRLSLSSQYTEIFDLLSRSSAFLQWIMWSFTAGVMLGSLALSSLYSSRIGDCKRAIARLVHALQTAGHPTALGSQTAKILSDLIHLIARQEVQAMITRPSHGLTAGSPAVPAFGLPENEQRECRAAVEGDTSISTPYNGDRGVSGGHLHPQTCTVDSNYEDLTLDFDLFNKDAPGELQEHSDFDAGQGSSMQMNSGPGADMINMAQTWLWNDDFSFI